MSGNLYFLELIFSSFPPTFTREISSVVPRSLSSRALSWVMRLMDDALSHKTFACPLEVLLVATGGCRSHYPHGCMHWILRMRLESLSDLLHVMWDDVSSYIH